ncbi:hypothetical protein Amsp01_082040 [Amycolatopsis sp. NBRC 101858]|uniref:hypothetical protein n=1 Tax=Amycolatopsis sp. NBRC 101858 TaxID=3032200 RepID=UPI0024A28163|nr:hypothetical protein [Amycolatopsis sp. NBRC 101858]GLY42181.1 hypothetical protein Amsp01_082040 [Amycolatopsis sp. NBRC 101858]
MTGRDPDDPEGKAAFRAFVRAHHPDVGGDPAVFAAGLARFRAAEPTAAEPARESEVDSRYDAPVSFVVNRRGIAAIVARFRRRRRRRRPPRVR